MNFENYNKIYKEILDDEKGEISSNYLLNKYKIKHDEELLNILNQIKKNEYISSDNKIINKLIKELDESDNLLDINEIINLKEKVIDVNAMTEENLETENTQIKTESIIEDKKDDIKSIIDETNYKKSPFIYIVPAAVIVAGIIFFTFPTETKDSEIIENKSIVKTQTIEPKEQKKEIKTTENIENKNTENMGNEDKNTEIVEKKESEIVENDNKEKLIEEKIQEEVVPEKVEIIVKKEDNNEIQKSKDVVEQKPKKKIEEKVTSEENLNKIEEGIVFSKNAKDIKKSDLKVNSLTEISKYIKEMKYKNNKILFHNNYYEEKDILLGFKIFKITPVYVKFEDPVKNIRKRFLLK